MSSSHNTRHHTAAQPEREAVLGLEWSEDGYSLRTPYDGDVNDDTGQHIVVGGETVVTFSDSDEGDRAREWFHAALTTPAPAAESDWFAGDVDCDGNELVTIRADELQKLRDEREKFMWQVRDTCTRAEKAEAALAATPAVSTDEIVAVFSENLTDQAARLRVHHNGIESPGQWRDRVRKAAILSRIRGEGE